MNMPFCYSLPRLRPAMRFGISPVNRRILIFLLLLFCISLPLSIVSAFAPITVTGTIFDANGNPYRNGTISAYPGSGPTSVNGTTDINGSFTIIVPQADSYFFTACAIPVNIGPLGNASPTRICFTTQPIAISGPAQDISAAMSAVSSLLGPPVITSNGGGTAPSSTSFAVSPPSITYGTLQVGVGDVGDQNVIISNTGTTTIVVTGAAFAIGTRFSSPIPGFCNGPLGSGASCALDVQYIPVSPGPDTDVLTISTTAGSQSIALAGTATGTATFSLTVLPSPASTGSGTALSNDGTNPCITGQVCIPPTISCSFIGNVGNLPCNSNYLSGTPVQVAVTPTAGNTLTDISIAGVACPSPCTVTMVANTVISITFTSPIPTFNLTLTPAGNGIGTTTANVASISCINSAGNQTGTCGGPVAQGTPVILTAAPSASCTGGPCTGPTWVGVPGCSNALTCTFSMNTNVTVSVEYDQPPGGSPASFVQAINGGTAGGATPANSATCTPAFISGTSLTTTVTCTIAAGHTGILFTSEDSSNTATATVSDSGGNTWTQTTSGYSSAGGSTLVRSAIFTAPIVTGVTSVTVNWSTSVSFSLAVLMDFTGMATSSLEDASVNINSNSLQVSTLTSGALTTTHASDVLFYGLRTDGSSGGFTVGSGYTLPANGVSNVRGMMQYKIVAATQAGVTTAATWATPAAAGSIFTGIKGGAGSNTISGNFASAQSLGDLNVCFGIWSDNTTTVTSITDTSGNTYTQFPASPKTIAGLTLVGYYSPNIAAASPATNTVTMALTASPGVAKINCTNHTGVIASPFDTSVGATGTGTALNSGTLTTATPNELLIGADNVTNAINAVSPGFTQRLSNSGNDVEDRFVTGAAGYNFAPTQGVSGNWLAMMGAFKTSGNIPTTAVVNITATGNGLATVSGGGLGCSINAGVPTAAPACSVVVPLNAPISITTLPAAGSSFVTYTGGGCGASPQCTTAPIVANTSINVNVTLPAGNNGPFNILAQQPPGNRPYPAAYYNHTLPGAGAGGPLTHLAANSAAIVSTVMQNGGGSLVTGSGFWNSPGTDDGQHRAFYYGQSTDPFYRVTSCGFNPATQRVNGQAFQVPSAAPYNEGNFDAEIAIWNQATNIMFQFYQGSNFPAALQSCSGTSTSPCTFTHGGNQYCSAMNYTTGSGIDAGTGASTAGLAPMGNIIRLTEIMNVGHINHGLRAVTTCNVGTVFPANYNTIPGEAPSGGAGQTCAAAGVSPTNRPPNGSVFFLDYTFAQLDCFNPAKSVCGGVTKLLNWQYMLIEAATLYGITTEDTGNGSSLSLPGIESEEAYLFLETHGYPGAAAIANQFTNFMNANCPASGDARCSVTNRCAGVGGSTHCANGHSQWQWNLNGWAGISNVGGTGIITHMHLADPCVIIAMQGLPNDGHGTAGCP